MSLLNLFGVLFKMAARRFVVGSIDEALEAARNANAKGIQAILDYLGEDVGSESQAELAVEEYLELLRAIDAQGVRACISIKMSQMGLLVSKEVCLKNVLRLAQAAEKLKVLVWMDMEGSALTQKTIEIFDAVRGKFKNIGLCLQASLVRTGGDLDTLLRQPLNVRLCKGAYQEPSTVAYTSKSAMNGNFRMLIQKSLEATSKGAYPAIATHDSDMIDFALAEVREKNLSRDHFEFQMLYGIQNKRLAALARKGFRASVYIPYGTHWLPYFIRRLRERKENLYFLLRNVFRA